jgi:hypothetical protein
LRRPAPRPARHRASRRRSNRYPRRCCKPTSTCSSRRSGACIPGLYRYNSPAQLDANLAALRRELGHDATLPGAWLAFSRFTASIRCGHTYPNPVNQSLAVQDRLFEAPTRLPFHFRWLDGRMVVLRNFSGDPLLAPGTQVLSVAGVPAPTLLARMLPLVRADGHNDGKRTSLLEVAGREKYETFDVLLPMLFPQVGSAPLLRVQPPGTNTFRELRVQAQTQAQRLEQRARLLPSASEPAWRLRHLEDGTALLEMPSWALLRPPLGLAGLAAARLRGSAAAARTGAGDRPARERRRRRSRRPAARAPGRPRGAAAALPAQDALPRLARRRCAATWTTWDPGFPRLGRRSGADGRRLLPARARGHRRGRRADRAGRATLSRPRVRAHQRGEQFGEPSISRAPSAVPGIGKLVGQATGGNLRGINGGAFFFLNLPNSRIEIDLPLIGQFPLEPQPDAGLTPDIEVPLRAQDIASGRDAELEAVRQDLRR